MYEEFESVSVCDGGIFVNSIITVKELRRKRQTETGILKHQWEWKKDETRKYLTLVVLYIS